MSHTIPIEQASIDLRGIVRSMQPGEEIVLTDNEKPIARIVSNSVLPKPPAPGNWKGKLKILDDSDDLILDHFKDYLS